MYNSTDVANRIKEIVKEKKITVKKMLSDLNINHNAITSMTKRNSWISCDSIAQIADYLDVSVDYLLGRTVDKNSLTEHEKNVIETYREHPDMRSAVDRLLGLNDK